MSRINPAKQISASGTPSSTTFLRGDGAWAVPGTSFGSTRGWRSASLSLADSTWVVIGFDHETRDELGIHDNSTNNDRFTIAATGRYRLTGQAGVTTATQMALRIMVNGSGGTRKAVVLTGPALASETVAQITAGTVDLTAGDYVQLWVIAFQLGGTTLDSPAEDACWFEVERVS